LEMLRSGEPARTSPLDVDRRGWSTRASCGPPVALPTCVSAERRVGPRLSVQRRSLRSSAIVPTDVGRAPARACPRDATADARPAARRVLFSGPCAAACPARVGCYHQAPGRNLTYDTRDSTVVPLRSTNRAWRGLASKFGMGFGACSCTMVVCDREGRFCAKLNRLGTQRRSLRGGGGPRGGSAASAASASPRTTAGAGDACALRPSVPRKPTSTDTRPRSHSSSMHI
jgi:hypothetical protein